MNLTTKASTPVVLGRLVLFGGGGGYFVFEFLLCFVNFVQARELQLRKCLISLACYRALS